MLEIDSPETAKRILRASRTWIFERTVGIYAQARNRNPRLEGSGVLLQIAEAPFMLSAGHVLKASEDAAISLVLEWIERANPDLGVSMRLTLRP